MNDEERKARERAEIERLSKKNPAPYAPPKKETNAEYFERIRLKASAAGRIAPDPDPALSRTRPRKETRNSKTLESIGADFFKAYPEIFKTHGLKELYKFLWKRAKQTRSKALRWEGFINNTALELGRSERQTRRDFKWLEKCNVLHRWNTGKPQRKDPNTGKTYLKAHTVVTLCWNLADFRRQEIARRIEPQKKVVKSAPAKTDSKKTGNLASADLPPLGPVRRPPAHPAPGPATPEPRPQISPVEPAWPGS